jgi:mannonate dehydratase
MNAISDYYHEKKRLEHTWRWFGFDDPVPLSHVAQAGATGIVSALYEFPAGEVWPIDDIKRYKNHIESAGFSWSVVESVPVHEDIKTRSGKAHTYLERYKQTIKNLGKAGIRTVCYNFMPVLDWTRTDLHFRMQDGSSGLRFEKAAYVAYDTGILKRKGAGQDYTVEELKRAEDWLKSSSAEAKQTLEKTIIAGLPGAKETYSSEAFLKALVTYTSIGFEELRSHLFDFVREIVLVAEENGVILTIHPDDPPYPLFGLPRIMSTLDDARLLMSSIPSPSNALCFCTGSYGVRIDNDLPAMIKELAPHIGFLHFRSTKRDVFGNFHEADHLSGDVDMYAVMKEILLEQQQREAPIPMRPDHGHKMLDDLHKVVNPGYSAIGRLKGLAELRGLELGILRSF